MPSACATWRARPRPRQGRKAAKAALPSFKQYREADGQHYFKLVDAGGPPAGPERRLRLRPRKPASTVAQLKRDGLARRRGKPCAWPQGVEPADVRRRSGALARSLDLMASP